MILNDLPYIMIFCLICTILIEAIIGFIIGIRKKEDIIIVILVNILTNPLVTSIPTFILIEYGKLSRIISLIILEILTFIIEGFIYKKTLYYKKANPYIISLILNICSYTLGLIIM
ncbi:MAG: hypothetical protein ACI4XM_06040 [Candidatus Coprovivens sp.]